MSTLRTVTAGLAAAIAAVALSGCGAIPASAPSSQKVPTVGKFDCRDLAKEAVRISKGEKPALIKVRSPKVKKDIRKKYKKPTGDREVVVFSCKGTGVWSDGSKSPVLLSLKVDADRDPFIYYQEL